MTIKGNYRWVICGLLFLSNTINYIDRQIISILKPTLSIQYNWTELDYGYLVMTFTLMYALGYALFGNFIDKVESKIGYSFSVVIRSTGAILHSTANSFLGFGISRAILGFGEAGNFPAGVKVIAEWFPKKERGIASGIFNAGTSVGSFLAPLILPIILLYFGWEMAFILTGSLGFLWVLIWWVLYEIPKKQKRLSSSELEHIASDIIPNEPSRKLTWLELLQFKQTWIFIIGKVMSDPIWWFFLFWLPSYFADSFGLDLTKPSLELSIIYATTTLGSIGGGYLSSLLIKKGWPILKARSTSLFIISLLVMPILFTRFTDNIWIAVIFTSLATAAHLAWSTNIFTIVSDMVPQNVLSSVVGIGGMFASITSALFPLLIGSILSFYKGIGDITSGYNIIFIMSGFAYLIAWVFIQVLLKNMKPMRIV